MPIKPNRYKINKPIGIKVQITFPTFLQDIKAMRKNPNNIYNINPRETHNKNGKKFIKTGNKNILIDGGDEDSENTNY